MASYNFLRCPKCGNPAHLFHRKKCTRCADPMRPCLAFALLSAYACIPNLDPRKFDEYFAKSVENARNGDPNLQKPRICEFYLNMYDLQILERIL